MTLSIGASIIMIAVVSVCTLLTRIIPFALFGGNKEMPEHVKFLGQILPPAIISTLIIYCLKSVNLMRFPSGLAELISIAAVAALHLWKRKPLLSIAGGTICYMFLVQVTHIGVRSGT